MAAGAEAFPEVAEAQGVKAEEAVVEEAEAAAAVAAGVEAEGEVVAEVAAVSRSRRSRCRS